MSYRRHHSYERGASAVSAQACAASTTSRSCAASASVSAHAAVSASDSVCVLAAPGRTASASMAHPDAVCGVGAMRTRASAAREATAKLRHTAELAPCAATASVTGVRVGAAFRSSSPIRAWSRSRPSAAYSCASDVCGSAESVRSCVDASPGAARHAPRGSSAAA